MSQFCTFLETIHLFLSGNACWIGCILAWETQAESVTYLQYEVCAGLYHLQVALFNFGLYHSIIHSTEWFMASSCHHVVIAVSLVFTRITIHSLQTSTVLILATLASLIQRVTGLYDPSDHHMALSIALHSRAAPSISRGTCSCNFIIANPGWCS